MYIIPKKSNIPIRKINEKITERLRKIYSKNTVHKLLADNTKNRSLADPWVIAHAMSEEAVVVTKEEKITASNSKKIKIPNVCENMEIPCINDFEMIKEMGLIFKCEINNHPIFNKLF